MLKNRSRFLHSFFVFDAIPPHGEGSDPVIYFYYTDNPALANNNTKTKDYKLNEVGITITFISFCQIFEPDMPCDYVFTKMHEISVLELSGSIWMAVMLSSNKAENRAILNSILHHFRTMFSSFFVPLGPISHNISRTRDQRVLDAIPAAFPSILNTVDWDRLDFRYLFNSYICQPMNNNVNIMSVCRQFLYKNSNLFDNILILYRQNKIIYSSFKPDVTRTLAFSMRRRFDHLFLHNPQKETFFADELTWLIGLFINKAGIKSIYQQPIFFEGKPHLLIAFRNGFFKIVLTQPPEIEVTEEMLLSIPKRLVMITQFLDKKNLKFDVKKIPLPYAAATNFYNKQQMTFESVNLDVASASKTNINFIKGHDYSLMYGKTALIAVPLRNQLFVRCERTIVDGQMKETMLMTQPTPGGISHNMKISSFILDQKEAKQKQSSCSIT